jgi:thiamine transport system permease protein
MAGAVSVAFIGLFVVWPITRLASEGLDATAFTDVFGSRRFRSIIWFTIWQATLSTLATLALGLPAAWLIGRHRFAGQRFLVGLWSAPFVMPSVVVGASFLALLPPAWERSVPAIIGAHIFFNVGMVARVIGEAWAQLDERFEQTAATLGATPNDQRMLAVRLLTPTVASMAGIVLSLCLTSFAVIQILGGPRRSTVESEIWRQVSERGEIGRASVLAGIQLLLVLGALTVTTRGRSGAAPAIRQPLPLPKQVGGVIITVLTVATAAPFVVLVQRSIRLGGPGNDSGYSFAAYRALGQATPGSGLLGSGLDAILTSIRSMVFATALAFLLVCCASVAGRQGSRLISALIGLPMAVSGVTLGLGTLLGFAQPPVNWRTAWWMVPIMQAAIALPFGVRVLRPAIEALDPRLREAAMTLGATSWQSWLRVDAMLLRGKARSAIGICAAISLGEFGATTFLVRPRSETIPIAIGVLSGRPGSAVQAQAAALAVILAILTVMLTFASSSIPVGISNKRLTTKAAADVA